MWFKRDIQSYLGSISALPIKVLKGPRQVGKTSLLEHAGTHKPIYFDDSSVRLFAQENPRLFFDQLKGPLILDEATLAPEVFPELKRRVDEQRRTKDKSPPVDIWITGSNQTLLQKNVRESLAGRASYFDLNTLSLHELKKWSLESYLMRGGWPELHTSTTLAPVRYLNDLISTFIEKDIVSAAGIEKKASFAKTLHLIAGRIGQLFNASDIAKNVSADVSTVQSWVAILEENGILRKIPPYFTNLNQRLIKSPKLYFEDVGLATRLQGWSDFQPLLLSPAIGQFIENIALGEIARFFLNQGERPQISFIRSKEKVEIDFLIHLPNQRYIAAEVKMTPRDLTAEQMKLLRTLDLNIVDHWILSPTEGPHYPNARVVAFDRIWDELNAQR